jgi:hypothetical protein
MKFILGEERGDMGAAQGNRLKEIRRRPAGGIVATARSGEGFQTFAIKHCG